MVVLGTTIHEFAASVARRSTPPPPSSRPWAGIHSSAAGAPDTWTPAQGRGDSGAGRTL